MLLNKDILLHILTLVPLEDALSFISVSRDYRQLGEEKSLWIHLLDAVKKTQPLPCPDDVDLLGKSVKELKRLAFHTVRREHRWSSETKNINYRDYTMIQLGPGYSLIHSIAGTPLLVVHSERDGTAVCYNIDTTRFLHSVHIGQAVFHISLVLTPAPGQKTHLIALLVTEELAVDYRGGHASLLVLAVHPDGTMDIPFRTELGTGFTFGQLFLNHSIVGLLRSLDLETLDILAFNLTSRACRIIHTDTLYDAQMGAYLDTNLYIVKDRSANSSNVYYCPSSLLPYQDFHDKLLHVADTLQWDDHGIRWWDGLDASLSGLGTWFEALGVMTAAPAGRGAALVTIHHINVDHESEARAINLRYWSYREKKADGDVTPSRRLTPVYTLNLWGMLATGGSLSRHRHLIAYSGLSVLLVDQYFHRRSVRLVRYRPCAASSSIHLLDLPSELSLNTISTIALDDHRGTITLLDQSGDLYSIFYA